MRNFLSVAKMASLVYERENCYGDADGNVQMNLYSTYESRDTLKSFTLFITVQAIAELNRGHRNKFEI